MKAEEEDRLNLRNPVSKKDVELSGMFCISTQSHHKELEPSQICVIIFLNLRNQPIRLPGLQPGVCSGLILSGAFYPDLKIEVWRRRTYQESFLWLSNILIDN